MHIVGNILKHLDIIPQRFYFDLVELRGVYSVYHYLDGSTGQKNFGSNLTLAEQHMDSQRMCSENYKQLIGKRDKLISRIAPISNKLNFVQRQIAAGILR